MYIRLSAEDRQKYGDDKGGRLINIMYGTQDASHTLICGELDGFRRGKHSAALFHNSNEDVRVAVLGDDFVRLSDDDGQTHRPSSQIQTHCERHGNAEDSKIQT